MADQYTVQLDFNRPPEDIKRIARNTRGLAKLVADEQISKDVSYAADVMDEIATKMEEQ